MLAVLVVIVIGAGLVVLAATAFSRSRHFNEVDRFHRASRMTSEWARSGVTRPVFAEPDDAIEPSEAPANRSRATR